ncbi:MAG: hypothetical protein NTW98_01105 [Candidatus Nomurabacteria bacterium]|nr:hypothetical protein [Candidatus Nomurabacteria bacterium]
MPKKILADMVPNRQIQRKIIKEKINTETVEISKPKSTKTLEKPTLSYLSDLPKIKHEKSSYKYDDGLCEADTRKNNKTTKHSLWVVAFISIVFLFFAFSSIFAKAKVIVDPKIESSPLNHNFSAFKDTNSDGVLPFSLVSLSGEESRIISSSEEKNVEEKAKGKVVIFNKFSTAPQSLSKDTRLMGTNNKIYKTEIAVTVPGMVKADIKKGIKEDLPGRVEVSIYADQSGEEYNSPAMDFKIMGFKGTKKYDFFDVKSNTPITGGLKGEFSFVSADEKTKVEGELRVALEEKLIKKITEEIPEGYILFKNATVFKTDDKKMDTVSKDKELPFVLRGTLYGFLFEEKSLTKKIAETIVLDYDDSEIYIPNLLDLSFITTLPVGITSYLNIKDIDFNLSGTPKVIWKVDEVKLKNALLAKPKSEFNHILTQFTNIGKANLILRPIWRRNVPDKSKDIKIIVNY